MGLFDRSAVFRVALAGVLIAALGLSACGRKGPTEAPPGAAVTNNDSATAGAKDPNAGKPKGSFVLDPLVR